MTFCLSHLFLQNRLHITAAASLEDFRPQKANPGMGPIPPLVKYAGHGDFFDFSFEVETGDTPPMPRPAQKFYKQNMACWRSLHAGDLSILQALP
jgi:hypothetical protein